MPQLEPTYLRYIYDGLVKGSIHPENAAELPDGLIGLYEEAFDERTSVVKRQKLLQRFAIWALLKKEVSAGFVAEVLGETEEEILNFISTYSAWFNSPESGKYQLYHERLKVYLLQKLSEGELNKLTEQIFQRLKIHFVTTNANEFHEYAQYYFLDYYNIIVNLNETLKINSELHKGYFLYVQKDATKLFYLENGRNHRERHLRQATTYFSRKKDLKVLDKLVHEINLFQNKRKTPLELSELIWSSNPNEQFYGYNLCSRHEDKLFVLVYSSLYHKDLKFSEWHLNVIKEYWKELKPTKKIYDLPSLFLLDIVPFLVDINLLTYQELEIKKIDFRFIYSLFAYRSFELFDSQEFNESEFIDNLSTSKVDVLYYYELQDRIINKEYFKRIEDLDSLDYNEFHFIIDPNRYFPIIPSSLPSVNNFLKLCHKPQALSKTNGLYNTDYDFIKLGDLWNDTYKSSITKELINSSLDPIGLICEETSFSDIFYNKCFSKRIGEFVIVYFGINQIQNNEIDSLVEKLSKLKIDIKFGYTRDSEGSKINGDDAFAFNEILYSIYSYCLFTSQMKLEDSECFLNLVIKDNEWFSKYFKPLYDWQKFMPDNSEELNYNLLDEMESERIVGMICNFFYEEKKIIEALKVLSSYFSKNDSGNNIYYELNFVNYYKQSLKNENILVDYYNRTNDIRQNVIPAMQYGIITNNIPLVWNFAHVNQSEMQKFGPSRSFSWHAISALFSFENIKFNIVFKDFLIPLLNSTKITNENNRKTSILLDFIEPIESADLLELLNSLKKYFNSNYIADYEILLFEKESDDSLNLKNLSLLKNGYLTVFDKIWKNSDFKEDLKNDLVKLESEKNFINNFNHNLYLLNIYFDHPEYINSIAFYSKLFKK